MATEGRQGGVFGAVPRYDSGPEIGQRMERDTQHEHWAQMQPSLLTSPVAKVSGVAAKGERGIWRLTP